MQQQARYTLRGDDALEARVARDLAALTLAVRGAAEAARMRLVAVALSGGFGRGEGGVRRDPDGSTAPYNDYDLFAITRGGPRWEGRRARRVFGRLAERWTERLGVEVEIGHLRAEALPIGPHSLMRCDLAHGARVLWGPADALAALPPMNPALLPAGEASALVVNRAALLAMLIADGVPESAERSARYRRKAVLAAGDALLIARGRHHSSAVERARRVAREEPWAALRQAYDRAARERLGEPSTDPVPLPFAAQVLAEALASAEARRLGVSAGTPLALGQGLPPVEARLVAHAGALLKRWAADAEGAQGGQGAGADAAEFLRRWRVARS